MGGITHRQFGVVPEPLIEPPTWGSNHSSTTLTSATVEKLEQAVRYGSRAWLDIYKPLRSIIEGYHDYVKITKHSPFADKSHHRVRGLAANAIVAVMSLVATNIRKIKSFHTGDQPRQKAGAPTPAAASPRRTQPRDPRRQPAHDPALPAQDRQGDAPEASLTSRRAANGPCCGR